MRIHIFSGCNPGKATGADSRFLEPAVVKQPCAQAQLDAVAVTAARASHRVQSVHGTENHGQTTGDDTESGQLSRSETLGHQSELRHNQRLVGEGEQNNNENAGENISLSQREVFLLVEQIVRIKVSFVC